MSYATVVLDQPMAPLTYRLTPATLAGAIPGALVQVPLGQRSSLGVVLRLERSVSRSIKEKLRPVTKILSAGVWAPPLTIRLARLMADYSGEPLGLCLFRLLPPASRRTNHGVRPSVRRLAPQTLHVYGPRLSRIEQYRTLIERAVRNGWQVILVAPLAQHERLTQALAADQPETEDLQEHSARRHSSSDQAIHSPSEGVDERANWRIQIVSAELAPTKQRQVAEDLATGLIDVLITTRQAVAWPAYALGAIIVDDPYHLAHVDEQRPYLDSATIALLRSAAEGGYAVLGAPLPSPALLLREQRGLARRLTGLPRHPSSDSSEVSNLVSSLRHSVAQGEGWEVSGATNLGGVTGSHSITILTASNQQFILPQIIERLGAVLQAGQRAAMIVPRHDGSLGVVAVEGWLADRAPELISQGVIVSTEGLLDSSDSYGAVAFLFAESALGSPDLDRPVRYLGSIAQAQGLTPLVLLQTHAPDQPWLRSLSDPTALTQILAERQAAHLPPYGRTLHLVGPGSAQAEAVASLGAYDLGRVEPVGDRVLLDLHVASADREALIADVATKLGRGWSIRADSVLEHAEAIYGRIRL